MLIHLKIHASEIFSAPWCRPSAANAKCLLSPSAQNLPAPLWLARKIPRVRRWRYHLCALHQREPPDPTSAPAAWPPLERPCKELLLPHNALTRWADWGPSTALTPSYPTPTQIHDVVHRQRLHPSSSASPWDRAGGRPGDDAVACNCARRRHPPAPPPPARGRPQAGR